MAELIGVYSADGGLLAEFRRMLGRRVGSHACWLSQLTHSPAKPTAEWRALVTALETEFGHTFSLAFRNTRTPEQEAASSGREPLTGTWYSITAFSKRPCPSSIQWHLLTTAPTPPTQAGRTGG